MNSFNDTVSVKREQLILLPMSLILNALLKDDSLPDKVMMKNTRMKMRAPVLTKVKENKQISPNILKLELSCQDKM